MKYKIAVDCDEVLNNLNEITTKVFNEENNTNLTEDVFTSYDIYKCLPFEDAEKYVALWRREDIWRSLTPAYHSQWGVKKLVDSGFDVYIATATHHENFSWKVEWLQSYFPFVEPSHIICIGDKSILNVDVMVEDCADNLINNIRCNRVLLEKPWNMNIHDEIYGIKRCANWDEIVPAIEEFYKNDERLMSN